MIPSARDVEEVVLSALKSGDWMRGVTLFAGAIRMPCVPTARTYANVVAAVAMLSRWDVAIRVLDRLHTSPLSARALYHTLADAVLATDRSVNQGGTLLALILAARRRRLSLAARHHMQCVTLLLESGNWQGALLAGSQERLVQHVPAIAHTLILAAAAGRQWLAGTKIMSFLLASGNSPSGVVTEKFICCFTPTSPWWRALAVASVLSCRSESGVVEQARKLREEVEKAARFSETDMKENTRQAVSQVADSNLIFSELTAGEAKNVFAELREQNWEVALDMVGAFPTLLETKPRPSALMSPMVFFSAAAGMRCRFWEVVWQAVSRNLFSAPIEEVFTATGHFYAYFYGREYHESIGIPEIQKEVTRVREKIGFFINARRQQDGGAFEPIALKSFVRNSSLRGFWEDALHVTEKPFLVFRELTECNLWQAALAVYYGAMQPSTRERAVPQLEHLFISNGLWMHALKYAQGFLPANTLPLRSVAIPLCAALGQWHRAVGMLLHYVTLPTAAEKSLLQHCIVQHAEMAVYRAFQKDDWIKALQAWTTIYRLKLPQAFSPCEQKRFNVLEGIKGAELHMSSNAVKCTAQLLMNHQRYDESCLVISSHKATSTDSPFFGCLQLFYYIRLSPLSYGKVLQKYRETYASYRAVVDCYAVLALGVSGNFLGAFSVLKELAFLKRAVTGNALVQGLKYVPQVKKLLSSILICAAELSQVADVEAVLSSLTECVTSLDDVDLLTDPLTALWKSKTGELCDCVFRSAVKLLRHMMTLDLPAPWAFMRIVADGLEDHTVFSTADFFFEALLRRRAFDTYSDVEGISGFLQPLQKEQEFCFQRCAQIFISGSRWGRALEALQQCETVDVTTLFHVAVFVREEEDDRARVAHRVIMEMGSVDGNRDAKDDSVSFLPGPKAVCDVLLALTQVHAWKAALVLFNNVGAVDHCNLGQRVHSWGVTIGALLSCVAAFGPWNVSLQLLMTATQRGFLSKGVCGDKALADVLRSVRRHSGAVMCTKVLLFMVEEIGVVPTHLHYEVLLRSCVGSQLTLVEQDMCAENLRRLSNLLSEKQVIDLITAIATSSSLWGDEETNGSLLRLPAWLEKQCGGDSCRYVTSTRWIPTERPSITADEFLQLCHLAPQIVLATSRVLEKLSKGSFSGRFRPFELKLLLQHYRFDLLAWMKGAEADTLVSTTFDTRLVEAVKNNQLLHLLLVPFYERSWRQLSFTTTSSFVAEEGDATAFFERLSSEVFHDFVSVRTMQTIWELVCPCVAKLAALRWPWLCEYELLRAVRRNLGKPPVSLCTRPGASKADIASYWATYGRIIWPELFFSGPELCQLAMYVPLVEPLLNKEEELLELIAGIRLAHFSAETIPYSERFLRRPRSVSAIRVVFRLAFKTLKRLYAQLDMDARSGCYYYYHQPDAYLWERYSAPVSARGHTPRWALALRIIRHYHRSTKAELPPRMLAAFFTACAAGVAKDASSTENVRKSLDTCSWWQLAIQCAQSVDKNLSYESWRHAMFLTSLTMPTKSRNTTTSGEYCLNGMSNVSLQASTRMLLDHVMKADGKIPFAMSLLLVEQIKELLSEVQSANKTQNTHSYKEDILIFWALMQTNRCLERMEPHHAELLKRLLFGVGSGDYLKDAG